MTKQEHAPKPRRRRGAATETQDAPSAGASPAAEVERPAEHSPTLEITDELLDEIDLILEDQEALVTYVQKGGQ